MLKIVNKILIVKTMTQNKEITHVGLVGIFFFFFENVLHIQLRPWTLRSTLILFLHTLSFAYSIMTPMFMYNPFGAKLYELSQPCNTTLPYFKMNNCQMCFSYQIQICYSLSRSTHYKYCLFKKKRISTSIYYLISINISFFY